MKAIGVRSPLPIDDPASLTDVDLPRPEPTGRDLVVRIEAVSVNPVDTEMRMQPSAERGTFKVLGWDAAGTVEAVGPEVSLFAPGDRVFYAGALGRAGTNAEFHLVDERIVGKKARLTRLRGGRGPGSFVNPSRHRIGPSPSA
ncbi:zinc-binding alcohol dehydrogenase family protein [Rhizobium grahamii CCGE 502]|uniref:Zinc-binding alcohol dehydrogenase family protein n=1 Tax=Rhizobium grahamii CCGE 502 TaxID=990285 RepID=S3HE42_9HYPH|nr:zinc-binding alcohol dehydrogenase family protein [Rhizobium grahamii CCGE 502]